MGRGTEKIRGSTHFIEKGETNQKFAKLFLLQTPIGDEQGWTLRPFPGFENAAGKLGRSGKQQQEKSSPNIGTA